MDGNSTKKSISLETLVIQNITNVNELKSKLHEIIDKGRDYDYDISSCIRWLLKSGDQELVLLSIQAIAELTKCENKRETFAVKEVIEPILTNLLGDATEEKLKLIKQSCRALGNLCCDCDTSRDIITETTGITPLVSTLSQSLDSSVQQMEEIKLVACKALLNYMIGGKKMAESVIETNLIDLIHRILTTELSKVDMNDDLVSTCLLMLSVINDNVPEYLFEDKINLAVLRVLRESASVEVSELCLDHLHMQAEHDSVKTLLAKEGGVQLVCSRLELLESRGGAREGQGEGEVEAVVKQACDLIVIVLTGDEAMDFLYANGTGEVYTTMVRWLQSTSPALLGTAVLAAGNFARRDQYCVAMMREGVFERLLDLFETYHTSSPEPDETTIKLEHAILSSLRNLLVPPENRKIAAGGRAAGALAGALPNMRGHHVAYKLMGAARMLAQEESVARIFAKDVPFLSSVSSWGSRVQYAGAAGEAPRLLAAIVARSQDVDIIKVEGSTRCMAGMLVAPHAVMHNEALLALALLAAHAHAHALSNIEARFVTDLVDAEIGKHISVLIETNCAKMPPEVAENLTAFLELTCKKNEVLTDYKTAKVGDSLKKMIETRKDISDATKSRMNEVLKTINDLAE